MKKNSNKVKNTKKNIKNKKSDKKINKKMIIISLIVLLLIVFAVTMIFLFNKDNVIICSKNVDENGILMKSDITFNTKDNQIKNIIVKKTLSITSDDGKMDYLGAIKDVLKENFESKKIEYKIEEQEDKLIINLKYDKKEEYILDNLFISIENSGININVMSEDRENNYATIDLSKEYNDKDIIKILEKADYFCK